MNNPGTSGGLSDWIWVFVDIVAYIAIFCIAIAIAAFAIGGRERKQ
jgi:hypothetical protein